jgi:hypothetical protein
MDRRLILFFIKELIRISAGLATSGLIQKLHEKYLRLEQAYPSINDLPHWHQCIKSRRGIELRLELNDRIVTHKNTCRDANIREIKIIESYSANQALNILIQCSSSEKYHALAANLAARNLIRRETTPSIIQNTILVSGNKNNANSLARIHGIFRQVHSFEPLLTENIFSAIAQIIRMPIEVNNDAMDIDLPVTDTALREIERLSFEEHYGHTSASYRPSVSTASPVNANDPSLGKNADSIADLNIDVPKEFECALSGHIMSDPVYFEDLPSGNIQCFERSWIMKHLERNSTHPITRERVSKNMLIENKPLQVAIEDFTAKKVRAHSIGKPT